MPRLLRNLADPGDTAELNPTALDRALSIMHLLIQQERPLSLSEIAGRLGMPKPTVHRLLARLQASGHLTRDMSGRSFAVGPRLRELSVGALASVIRQGPQLAALEALTRDTGESCNVGVLDGSAVILVERIETTWPIRVHLHVGARLPLHATALGKLFLSRMPRSHRQRYYEANGLQANTQWTITEPEALERDLALIRAEDVAFNDQGYLPGVFGIAVPIRAPDAQKRYIAGLSLQTTQARIPPEGVVSFVPALRETAARLARAIYAAE